MRSGSIGRRLTWLSILSSGTALLSASVAFVIYDVYTVRQTLLGRLRTAAEIMSFNSASSLVFDDAESARTMLSAMKGEPNVVSAAIIAGGHPFASYVRPDAELPVVSVPADGAPDHRFTARHLFVFHPIALEGRRLGTLVIQSDLHEIHQRLRRYATIVVAISMGAVLLAILTSRKFQSGISRPILQLAEVAHVVSAQKDYSVRAPLMRSAEEIELLVRTFNEMLGEIELQHAHLREARTDLERRVEDRMRELAAANRELEAFSYSVSHDLRAPLRAIDGFSKALLNMYDAQLDERGRHFLERVRSGTRRMSDLIDDLLTLARVTRAELVCQTVDITELARVVGGDLVRRDPLRRVDLDVQEGMVTQADPHLLQVVLENLVGNSWKFTSRREGARIEVGEQWLGGVRTFFVRDNGAGFDMIDAGRLFGPFQRLHEESEYEGTGIGLATVQRIITRHGGRIWAEATMGHGATFFFTLGEAA